MDEILNIGPVPAGIPEGSPLILVGRGWTYSTMLGGTAYVVPMGIWVGFASSYTNRALWWPDGGDVNARVGSLFVEVLSLAVFRYDHVGDTQWRDFLDSSSHGQWFYYQMGARPYHTLRGPQRKVTRQIKEWHLNRQVL